MVGFHVLLHIIDVGLYRDGTVGVEGFHARDEQKGPVRAIVEGDLFLSARSSLFFLLSFFFFLSPRIVPKNEDLRRKKQCFKKGPWRPRKDPG